MSANPGQSKLDQVLAQEREYRAKREGGYREQALKLYPWICGRCTREFTSKNLSEFTTEITTTITTHPTARIGNYCASTATIMSIHASKN